MAGGLQAALQALDNVQAFSAESAVGESRLILELHWLRSYRGMYQVPIRVNGY